MFNVNSEAIYNFASSILNPLQVYKVPHAFTEQLLHKILLWAQKEEYFIYFNPNNYPALHGAFDHFIAVGKVDQLKSGGNSFEQLATKLKGSGRYWAGYFSYELKNEICEDTGLNATPPAEKTSPPHLEFFSPETLIFFRDDAVEIQSEDDPESIYQRILEEEITVGNSGKFTLHTHTSKKEYLENCGKIKEDIVNGEYYELNYCIEFYAENCEIDPIHKYFQLNALSPMPFSCLGKFRDTYVICASPERFLKKEGNKLISQPIKGTARRGKNKREDVQLKTLLRHNEKEIAENMMIVDLVRNDLSKSSVPGSVKVEEFFGIYTFRQVHQMISTVSSTKRENIDNIEIIKNAFPMGSMTGAPKIRVMQAIDSLEKSRRGIYSGAIGYFKPNGDFDFNVVIRSIVYDDKNKKLSFHVGSAITYDADAEYEYEECLLKAKSMMKILSGQQV